MKLVNNIAAMLGAREWLLQAGCRPDWHALDILFRKNDISKLESALEHFLKETKTEDMRDVLTTFLKNYGTKLSDGSLQTLATMGNAHFSKIVGGFRNDAPEGWVETEQSYDVDYSSIRTAACNVVTSRKQKLICQRMA